jgi:hypothetical protein
MLDSDVGQKNNKANALRNIIKITGIKTTDFDETLLHRLAAIVDANSHHRVKVQAWWCQRHAFMNRRSECVEACQELLVLAAAPLMAQNVDVQRMAHDAKKYLSEFHW